MNSSQKAVTRPVTHASKREFTKLVLDKGQVDGNSYLEKGELNVNSCLVKDVFSQLLPSKRRVHD